MIPEHERLQACLKDLAATHDATIKRMAGAGYSDVEIGQHIGRDRRYVWRRRQEMHIKPGQSPVLRAMMARLHLRKRSAFAA